MTLKVPSAFSTTKSTYERSRRTLASSCGPKCNDPSHGHRQKTVTRSMTKADALNNALDTKTVENLQRTVDVYDAEKDKEKLEDFRRQSENPAAQLDYVTWLKFAAPTYNICPHIEGYIIVNTLVCPSDIPNRNGIAFPAKELARFLPPPTNRMAYKAWTGCPVHLEHDNEVHERAYGVILDSAMTKIHGYGGGKLWKVMGLLAIDKDKHPDIAQKVLTKEINTYSMGAMVDYFTCGYCGTECNSQHVCSHITSPKNVNWKEVRDYDGSSHLAFLNAHNIQPIECSIVADPAWAPALSDEVFDPWATV